MSKAPTTYTIADAAAGSHAPARRSDPPTSRARRRARSRSRLAPRWRGLPASLGPRGRSSRLSLLFSGLSKIPDQTRQHAYRKIVGLLRPIFTDDPQYRVERFRDLARERRVAFGEAGRNYKPDCRRYSRKLREFFFERRDLKPKPRDLNLKLDRVLIRIPAHRGFSSSASIIFRTAAERDIGGSWPAAHLSSALIIFSGKRSATSGSLPVAGRPRCFGITTIDFRAMLWLYLKGEPMKSGNFPSALTSLTERIP
jgi:hypothetical protein